MKVIKLLNNIYDKIKTSYDNYWKEYEEGMESLSPEEKMYLMDHPFGFIRFIE